MTVNTAETVNTHARTPLILSAVRDSVLGHALFLTSYYHEQKKGTAQGEATAHAVIITVADPVCVSIRHLSSVAAETATILVTV